MKWVRRSLVVLLALGTLAVAAAGVVLWALGSEPGSRWLVGRLLARAPALTVGRVGGSLLGGLVLEDVHLRLARDELDFARLELRWDVAAALTSRVAFAEARVSPVEYRRIPAAGGGRSAALDLPFEIVLEDATAESVAFEVGGGRLKLGRTRFAARFANRRLELERVASTWRSFALEGSGSIALRDAVTIAAEGSWSGPTLGAEGAGRVTVEGDWPVLTVHHELSAPFTAVADGELTFAGVPRADLTIEWQDLALPRLERYRSPRGRLALAGALADYTFDGSGTLDLDGRAAEFTARGSGKAAALTVSSVVLHALAGGARVGTVEGSGGLSLDARDTELTATVREFDPSWLLPAWPGRLSGTAKVSAELDPRPEARFDAIELAGELRKYSATLRGAATVDVPDRWRLDGARLESGPNVVAVDGTFNRESLDLHVGADVAQLDLLWPAAAGELEADLSVDGARAEPHARGSVELRALALRGYSAERLRVVGEVGLAAGTPLDLMLDGTRVARGPLVADTVHAEASGSTSAHRVSVEARAAEWVGTLRASGGLEAGVWRGSLETLDFDELLLGQWRLTEPTRVALGRHAAALATSCLLHESGARWCAELDLQGRPEDRLVLSAQNVALATLKPLLPRELSLDGVYQLSASLADLTGEPHGAVALNGSATRARVAFGEQQAFATELDDVRASATLHEGRLELTANVRSGEEGRLELNASVEDVRAQNSRIGGGMSLRWPDLAFLALLSPELGRVGGALAVDLTVGGTAQSPQVEGSGALHRGQVAVPAWGLVVEGIEATAKSGDGRNVEIDATGRVGDAELKLSGTTALDPRAGWPTRLKLRGESVRAVQLPEVEIFATPDLDIVAELPDVKVTGTLLVPRAAVQLSALPAQAVAPSPDAVLHGKVDRREVRPLHLQADVALTLGDDVRYTGLNLETKVAGQLRLDVDTRRSTAATGTLSLTGTYNAYGQRLQLDRGQLLFAGPLDDPGLDVRAVRQIDETRVGIELAGSVKAPRTRVFSTPAMSEADALSYLLLGRPVTGTGGEETATLQTAALSMGLQQALPVVQRIGQTLGLDEFTVQGTEEDAGALMAGKYLSPKVYIRYSYGLFNRIGGLLLRFKVNERLSIETRSGDQKSMDLLYTVEKD